jgi:hypothetical protein
MSVSNRRAVSASVEFSGGEEEKRNPGREGTITLNDTFFPVGLVQDWVNGLMTEKNSWMEPEEIRINIISLLSRRIPQTWPSMNEQERDGVLIVGFFMYEMNSLVFNGGCILCEPDRFG